MPTTISARLAKSPNDEPPFAVYQVLCGRVLENGNFGCGGELGTLMCLSPRDGDDASWSLLFGPVMVRNHDGVWQLTRRAAGRLRHITELASDPTTAPPVRERARSLLKHGVHRLSFMTSRLHEGTGHEDAESEIGPPKKKGPLSKNLPQTGLPCQVRCPRCAGVNEVGLALITEARRKYAQEEEWYRQARCS